MRFILLLLICGFSQFNTLPVGRIINGQPAEFVPHACLLFVRLTEAGGTGLLGGGSIITNRHVITVAHLVHRGESIQVGFGGLIASEMTTIITSMWSVHPQFVAAPNDFDIAIVILPLIDPIEFNDVTQPIALPPLDVGPNDEPAEGTDGTVAGFGFTFEGQIVVSELRLATATVVGIDVCNDFYQRELTTHFCAQDSAMLPSNVCPGDNGSGFYTGEPAPVTESSEEESDESEPEESVPDESVPEESIPDESVPEESIPDESVPEESVPDESVPEESVPEESIPEESIPEEDILRLRKKTIKRHKQTRDGENGAVLVGLASIFPHTCTNAPAPAAYTRISFFRHWIGDIASV